MMIAVPHEMIAPQHEMIKAPHEKIQLAQSMIPALSNRLRYLSTQLPYGGKDKRERVYYRSWICSKIHHGQGALCTVISCGGKDKRERVRLPFMEILKDSPRSNCIIAAQLNPIALI